jgi:1-deoxy-D-xylulose-5-phosphate reductoisomerase
MLRGMKKRIVILGSTGSIGTSTLQVVKHLPEELEVVGIAARSSIALLASQAAELNCRWAATSLPEALPNLRSALPESCQAFAGEEAICDLVTREDVDMVLCAIVGTAGLQPVLRAIRAGKDIALATKEIMVLAGELVMAEAQRCGVRILPVDSEHAAIFQCLEGHEISDVRRLIITASGGPFRHTPAAEMAAITPAQALKHPTWNMGPKITIDSSTLMNKGLEMIEAARLFLVPPEKLDVVVHPQSIIHSMVEFTDGSILAQLGWPDMRLPIQVALTHPRRLAAPLEPFDFTQAHTLQFEPPDTSRFPALELARQSLVAGGTMTAVFNAANEVAVDRFCAGKISFPEITATVERTMAAHDRQPADNLDVILAADAWARCQAAL